MTYESDGSFFLSFLLFVLDMYLPFFYRILVNKNGVCRCYSKPFTCNSWHDHIIVFTLPTRLSIYMYLLLEDTQGIIQIWLFLFLSFFLIIMGRSWYIFHSFILFWWIIMEFVDVTQNPFHAILNRINVYTFRLFLLSFCFLWYSISIIIIWWLLTAHISQPILIYISLMGRLRTFLFFQFLLIFYS